MSIIKGKVGTGETDYKNSPRILLDVNISDRTDMLDSIKSRVDILIKTQDNENYKIYNGETGPDNDNRDYTPRSIDSNDVINIFSNKITSAYQYQRIEKTDFDFSILTIAPTDDMEPSVDIIVKTEYDNIYVYRYFKDNYEPTTLSILSRNEVDDANFDISNFDETHFQYEIDSNNNTITLIPINTTSEETPITTKFRLYSSDTGKTVDVYVFAYIEYYKCYTSRTLDKIESNAKCYTSRTLDKTEQ